MPVTTSSPPVAGPSFHSGTHPQHRGMLDVPALEAVVQRLYGHGLSQNSTRTYDSASRRFLWFCDIAGLSPLPLTERTLCLYVESLSQDRIQPSSIRTYLSSLRHLKSQLVSQFHTRFPRLSYVLRGIKRQNPSNPDNRLPITPDILQSLWQQWAVPPVSYDARLLWAAACLAFFGFFRTGEFTTNSQHTIPEGTIAATDVTRATNYPPAFVRVRLRRSKTDPYGNEIHVYLGRTQHSVCPVSAILSFMAARPHHLTGPLFRYPDDTTLTRSHFIQGVKRALSSSGVDPSRYSGHSFRVGAATTAAQVGIPDHTIKMLGRWESSAYTLYVRTPSSELANISGRLLSTHTSATSERRQSD